GVAGLKTAFVARYKKGTPGPNLGVILEYDALRGTTRDFHGDQHSAQGPVGMAAAVAVAEFLSSSKTPGTVTVYGTPAEEVGAPEAKTTMFEAGVFKGADVLIRSHSSTGTQRSAAGFGSCCMNIDVVHYTFSGAPAHQLQAWEGRDALLGVIELFNHIDALRKNARPEARIQGIITEGGKAPNVVPDRADAQAMAAVLYHYATDAPYRATVKREFDGLKGLYSEYLAALRGAYPLPTVPEPTGN